MAIASSDQGASQISAAPEMENAPSKLALNICIGWGLGTLGLQVLLQVVNTLVLKYMTDILGLAAAAAGLIIAGTRIYDALVDPVMGSISDRTNSRWGRRRPYLLLGAFLCALCPILLFVVPQYLPAGLVAGYMVLGLILYATAYTVYNVPLLAMPVEMTQEPKQRTHLFSFRMYGFSLGLLFGGSGAVWLVGEFGGSAMGYQAMAVMTSLCILISCLSCFFMTAKAPVAEVSIAKKTPQLAQFKIALENKPLRTLLLLKVCLVTGVSVSGGGLAFFVATVMERSLSVFPIFGITLTLAIMLCQSSWLKVANRIGKNRCYLIAASIYTVGMLSWVLSGPAEPLWVFGLRGAILGIGAGGALLASQSMLPDVLQYEIERTETRNEGILTGMFSTVERGSSALGIALGGAILSIGGYISGNPNAIQPDTAKTAIIVTVGIAPAIGVMCSMVAASFFHIPEMPEDTPSPQAAMK